MTDLLPCAHCGSKPSRNFSDRDGFIVRCGGCGAQTGTHMSMLYAEQAWNRRVPDKQAALSGTVAPPAGLVDEVPPPDEPCGYQGSGLHRCAGIWERRSLIAGAWTPQYIRCSTAGCKHTAIAFHRSTPDEQA